jgi:ADP-dependent phosphofructokinase/glucokinase
MTNPTTRAGWLDAYGDLVEHISAKASSACPVLTGQSACVDGLFTLTAKRLVRLASAASGSPTDLAEQRGSELIRAVLERVKAGRGGELVYHWRGGPSWLIRLLGPPDRTQLGGTGPQASWALANVGAPSVLALSDRSEQQLSVIDPRTGLCVGNRVVPAGEVVADGNPSKLLHCVLEFAQGTPFHGETVPRSTRIILRFGDEPVERDEDFAALTPHLPGVRAALISGLNGPSDGDTVGQVWLTHLAESWRAAGIPTIHHELAEFSSVQRLRDALDTRLGTSVGLSLSELTMLTGRTGDPRLLARDVAERACADRVVVHADEWSMAVYRSRDQPPVRQLLGGNLLAAARGRVGRPTGELEPAESAQFTEDRPADGRLDDTWSATAVPSPYLRRPVATIGLGDTFVAGLLLAESLP